MRIIPVPEGWVRATTYADTHDMHLTTVYNWLKRGWLKGERIWDAATYSYPWWVDPGSLQKPVKVSKRQASSLGVESRRAAYERRVQATVEDYDFLRDACDYTHAQAVKRLVEGSGLHEQTILRHLGVAS